MLLMRTLYRKDHLEQKPAEFLWQSRPKIKTRACGLFHVDEHVKLLPRNVRCFPFDSVVKLLLFLKFYEKRKR